MNERMKEIEKRLAEIKEEVDKPEADLDALQEESRKLADEYDELKQKVEAAEKRQAILDAAMREGRVTRRFSGGEEREERTFAVDTPEYRVAWLKNLQGKPLNAEERTAITASAAIPTQTMNMIVGRLDLNPLLNAIDISYIPSNISFPV